MCTECLFFPSSPTPLCFLCKETKILRHIILQDLFLRWPLGCWWQAAAPWAPGSAMISAPPPPPHLHCLSFSWPRNRNFGARNLLYNGSLLMWKLCWYLLLLGQVKEEKATAAFRKSGLRKDLRSYDLTLGRASWTEQWITEDGSLFLLVGGLCFLKAHKALLGHLGRVLKCGNNPSYLDPFEIITIKCVNLILPLEDQ